MPKQKKIYLECSVAYNTYYVKKLINRMEPEIGSSLTPTEVKTLLDSNDHTEVIITGNKL